MASSAETSSTLPDRCQNLAGDWRLLIGAPEADPGLPLPPLAFNDHIQLPATTETAHKGPWNKEQLKDGLTAVRRLEGPVWYERDFNVPDSWRGCRSHLLVERSKWSALWLDGQPLGVEPLLCTPHRHELGVLAPGRHRLTLCVDNRRKPAPGDNHQVSTHTQGNWNGLLGRIELRRSDATWIQTLRIRPLLEKRSFAVSVHLGGSALEHPGLLTLEAESFNHKGSPQRASLLSRIPAGTAAHSFELPLGDHARTWDEFSPALYRLRLRLEGNGGTEECVVTSGLRRFGRSGTRFTINGRPVFLRGEVNCCVFPLTGHPPMEKEGWLRYYRVLLAHGINHVRFHSWTPPEAAFEAADELGLYLLTELPFWGKWTRELRRGLQPEAEAILQHFGHHPSLVLLTLGNEHQGERDVMRDFVADLRRLEPGLLIAQGANNYLENPSLAPGDDFWISARLPQPDAPKGLANLRGSFSTNDVDNGHLQVGRGGTRTDYSQALKGVPIPVLSHEIGQFTTLPDFGEIPRYTGVFEARNLKLFAEKAQKAGLQPQSRAAFQASGRLASLLYREEVEAALRTPGMAGFQLLGLQDFPGQGTALVGILNAFLEPKGSISAEEFRLFCGPEVLLARFDRHTWVGGERFRADLELANFGPSGLPSGVIHWELLDRVRGGVLASGRQDCPTAPQGEVARLGTLLLTLPSPPEARQLELRLELLAGGRRIRNNYPLWLFPDAPAAAPIPPAGLRILRHSGPELLEALAAGASVLFMPDASHPLTRSPGGGFTTDFWCWPMFHNRPGTMGLLIQAGHPSLASFPTATHSDWQWFHLAKAALPLQVENHLAGVEPTVRVLDNLERCQQLALLFEARVGPGRLLFCAIDLPALASLHPEARQLLKSLQDYAVSDAFHPRLTLAPEILDHLLQS